MYAKFVISNCLQLLLKKGQIAFLLVLVYIIKQNSHSLFDFGFEIILIQCLHQFSPIISRDCILFNTHFGFCMDLRRFFKCLRYSTNYAHILIVIIN